MQNAEAVKIFKEGLAAFSLKDSSGIRWGFVNDDGKVIINPMFSKTGNFSDGKCAVENSEGKWGYIDKKDHQNNYRHLRTNNNQVTQILEKKEKKNIDKVYLGLAYIKNYNEFKKLCKKFKKLTLKYGEVAPLRAMINNNFKFKPVKQIWSDTGNLNDYLKLKKKMDGKNVNILSKPNEEIWFVKDRVIKFSTDVNFIKNRVKRIKFLKNYTPKVLQKKKNFFAYQYSQGELFSNKKKIKDFKLLLKFSKKAPVKLIKSFRSTALSWIIFSPSEPYC
jgi:hypothetical protein